MLCNVLFNQHTQEDYALRMQMGTTLNLSVYRTRLRRKAFINTYCRTEKGDIVKAHRPVRNDEEDEEEEDDYEEWGEEVDTEDQQRSTKIAKQDGSVVLQQYYPVADSMTSTISYLQGQSLDLPHLVHFDCNTTAHDLVVGLTRSTDIGHLAVHFSGTNFSIKPFNSTTVSLSNFMANIGGSQGWL